MTFATPHSPWGHDAFTSTVERWRRLLSSSWVSGLTSCTLGSRRSSRILAASRGSGSRRADQRAGELLTAVAHQGCGLDHHVEALAPHLTPDADDVRRADLVSPDCEGIQVESVIDVDDAAPQLGRKPFLHVRRVRRRAGRDEVDSGHARGVRKTRFLVEVDVLVDVVEAVRRETDRQPEGAPAGGRCPPDSSSRRAPDGCPRARAERPLRAPARAAPRATHPSAPGGADWQGRAGRASPACAGASRASRRCGRAGSRRRRRPVPSSGGQRPRASSSRGRRSARAKTGRSATPTRCRFTTSFSTNVSDSLGNSVSRYATGRGVVVLIEDSPLHAADERRRTRGRDALERGRTDRRRSAPREPRRTPCEEWSGCRAPSGALRRIGKGWRLGSTPCRARRHSGGMRSTSSQPRPRRGTEITARVVATRASSLSAVGTSSKGTCSSTWYRARLDGGVLEWDGADVAEDVGRQVTRNVERGDFHAETPEVLGNPACCRRRRRARSPADVQEPRRADASSGTSDASCRTEGRHNAKRTGR